MSGTARPTPTPTPAAGACPYCGWPDRAEPFQVVSRHGTAGGQTVWTRCACGSLQARVVDARGVRVLSRSRGRGRGGSAESSLRAGGGWSRSSPRP
ncbi:hypothetical protein [Streptomyces sp. MMBL 11-3]|uniref:hypothetical protein n=1 Tax=Streptomyces sp. MMBL 11-3 TaxID=3382639 RepID=UPI0039B62625